MLKKENYPTASCESQPISLRHLSPEDALEKWNTLPREREIRRLDKSCGALMKQSDYLAEQLEKKAICRVKEVNGHMELSALTREDWLILARKSAEGNGGAE